MSESGSPERTPTPRVPRDAPGAQQGAAAALERRGPLGAAAAVPRALPAAIAEVRRNRGRGVANSRPLPPWVKRFAWVLDDAFEVPGMPGRRVGVDGLVAIVPVAGDAVGIALSMVVIAAGIAAGVSIPTVLRMLFYVGFEALIGLVPLGGTVFNMAFKANNRNVALIEADLADRRRTRRSSLGVLALLMVLAFIAILMLIVFALLGITVLVWFVTWLVGR